VKSRDVLRAGRKLIREGKATLVRVARGASRRTHQLTARREMTREALEEAKHYLSECGLRVPVFRLAVHRRWAGSYMKKTSTGLFMSLGTHPTRAAADWFVMHELGHVLWVRGRPTCDPRFKEFFGTRPPRNYDDIGWSVRARRASDRSPGFPSHYAELAGGEEALRGATRFHVRAVRGLCIEAARRPGRVVESCAEARDRAHEVTTFGMARGGRPQSPTALRIFLQSPAPMTSSATCRIR
jgi:hypothetical protein